MTLGEVFVLAALMSQVARSRSARKAFALLLWPLAALVLYRMIWP